MYASWLTVDQASTRFRSAGHEGETRSPEHRDDGDESKHVHRDVRQLEEWQQPCHQVDPRSHHRRGVDESADRRRTRHRVGQPRMQRELGRLADDTTQDEQAGRRRLPGAHPAVRHRGEHPADAIGAGRLAGHEDPEQQPDVAEPRHQERLHRTSTSRLAFPVVRDEEVGAGAHDLPTDEQHEEVVSSDHERHRCREEHDEGRVRRVARVLPHVGHRVDLHEQGDAGDEHQHRDGELVRAQRRHDRDAAGRHRARHQTARHHLDTPVFARQHEGEQPAPGHRPPPEGLHDRHAPVAHREDGDRSEHGKDDHEQQDHDVTASSPRRSAGTAAPVSGRSRSASSRRPSRLMW